ncbi:MAG: hypothetical protein ACREV7_22225, partial [Steroidobacteraceae bacterium]
MRARGSHTIQWRLLTMAGPGALVLAFFFFAPLIVVSAAAFEKGGAGLRRTFSDPLFWQGLEGSFALALGAGTISLLVGSAVAFR